MKRIKRIAALLLIVAMLLSAVPASAAGEAAVEVQTVMAKPGESVAVTVQVKNSPGITSMKLKLAFGSELTLTGVSYNTEIGGQSQMPQKLTSPVTLNWVNGMADVEGSWIYATLTFRVASNAVPGVCPISVSYDPDDVYNIEETNVDFAVQNGGIQIESNAVSVAGVALNKSTLTMTSGETVVLTASIAPDNATNQAISWKSSDSAVAAVDSNGKITAVKKGTATITVTTADGGFCASCTVTVECSHENKIATTAKSPDCIYAGNHLYYTCAACGDIFKADGTTKTSVQEETLPALGHDMEIATCTAPATCKRTGCDHTEGAALGHDMSAATCTVPAACKRSGCGYTEGTALGHTPGAAATEYTDQVCTVCGYVIVPALGHTHSTSEVTGFAATCTEPGQKTYYTCACGKWFEDSEATGEIADYSSVIVTALGHELSPATCTEPQMCQREDCGYTQGTALGHNWLEATCQRPKTCERCEVTEGEALPHTPSQWKHSWKKHWKACESCGAVLEGTSESHADADANGVCDACGYTIPEVDPENPKTGDLQNPWHFLAVLMLSMSAMVMLSLLQRKNKTV